MHAGRQTFHAGNEHVCEAVVPEHVEVQPAFVAVVVVVVLAVDTAAAVGVTTVDRVDRHRDVLSELITG